MYIGEIIKEYRELHGISPEEFAQSAGLSAEEIRLLESLIQEDGITPVPVAFRQLKAVADVLQQPMPVIMSQISKDQQIIVNVVAESDQPHAK